MQSKTSKANFIFPRPLNSGSVTISPAKHKTFKRLSECNRLSSQMQKRESNKKKKENWSHAKISVVHFFVK